MTVLIYLGYLTFDEETGKVYNPNGEVRSALEDISSDVSWEPVIQEIDAWAQQLKAVLLKDENAAARGVEDFL